jgi:hypothetical protein
MLKTPRFCYLVGVKGKLKDVEIVFIYTSVI